MEKRIQGIRLALFAALLLGCAGCASVTTVSTDQTASEQRLRHPDEIWVRPFATDGGMWLRDAAEPRRREEIQDWLTGSLLRHLSPIAPTHLLEDRQPERGWLVSGRFLRVNPGSRFGRMFFGGLRGGASQIETRVNVYDLAVSSTDPVLSFTTTGGSNRATGLHGALNSTDDDVDRTAREILQHLRRHLWTETGGVDAGSRPASSPRSSTSSPAR